MIRESNISNDTQYSTDEYKLIMKEIVPQFKKNLKFIVDDDNIANLIQSFNYMDKTMIIKEIVDNIDK